MTSRASTSPRLARRSTATRSPYWPSPGPRPSPRPSSTTCCRSTARRCSTRPALPSPRVRVPVLLAAPAILALAFLLLPLVGLLVRAPWGDAGTVLGSAQARQALGLSLATATVPLVLPPVVGGVALFTVLGRSGLLGRPLYTLTGFAFPFTPYAVVLAQTFVAMPFLVLAVEGALRASDPRYEEAAATLGARPLTVFRRVTLPLVGPGIAAGAVLAWARALGEFGATITFAGNFPGTTRTMPLEVYLALETDPGAALLLSVLLLGASIFVLVLLRDRWFTRW